MKIVHISISGDYTDGLGYQDNIITKYHVKMGYEVTLIASEWKRDKDGSLKKCNASHYMNNDGVKIIRLPLRGRDNISKRIRVFDGLFDALETESPDIIFHHGCQSVEEATVVKYMKQHSDVKLFVDNHADFSNSASNWISKNIQHKILWRYYAKKLCPYVQRFWGVLPARVDFLVDLYKLPREKVGLLVMGADDELVEEASKPEVKQNIREQYGIAEDDFLIMNGGKIDQWKKQTLLLMDAVNEISDPKIKLIIFGSVTPELKNEVEKRCSDKVQYIGWVQSDESYKYFAACDLAVFPGRHSVFWEQVAGQGIPMIVKYWEGTTHVDCGGNVKFLYKDSVEEISQNIKAVIKCYKDIKVKAEKAMNIFSYSDIASRSIKAKG
ncbi:MAG: glycosyltransferase [Clostridiales bacterium]|nr:glycosyltransferase [Clostridiales bacterium]